MPCQQAETGSGGGPVNSNVAGQKHGGGGEACHHFPQWQRGAVESRQRAGKQHERQQHPQDQDAKRAEIDGAVIARKIGLGSGPIRTAATPVIIGSSLVMLAAAKAASATGGVIAEATAK